MGDLIFIRGSNPAVSAASGMYVVSQSTIPITIEAYTFNADSIATGNVNSSIGLIEVTYEIDVEGGSTADYDQTVGKQFRVNSWQAIYLEDGTTGDTIQLADGNDNPISSAQSTEDPQWTYLQRR